MGQALTIWTPVVISKLERPCHLQAHYSCALDQIFRSIEDLKIKVKTAVVRAQGLAVEALLRLDILCLVEDASGQMHLISREETVRNRIPLEEFDLEIDRERELRYVLDVMDIDCRGELKNQELHIDYFIDFMVIGMRDQVVRLAADEEAAGHHSLQEALLHLQAEVNRVETENRELRRRIYFYERDIGSLKKGIRKSEASSSRLSREVTDYQQLVEELQEALRDKDRKLQNLGNPYYSPLKHTAAAEPLPAEELPLGARIKRLFLNSSQE